MDDQELTDLLDYVRDRMRRAGRSDLDERLWREVFSGAQRSTYSDLILYLSLLRTELVLGSATFAQSTLARFSDYSTEEGGAIIGFVVDVVPPGTSDDDLRAVPNVEPLPLDGSQALDDAIVELDELLAIVRRSG